MRSTVDLGKYLGLPVVVGCNRKRAFGSVKDRFLERIGGGLIGAFLLVVRLFS